MNIESIAKEVVERVSGAPVVAPPLPSDEKVAARFAQVMSAPSIPSAQLTASGTPAADNGTVKTPGETLLSSMQDMSTKYRDSWTSIRSALDGRLEMQEMLKLQVELTQTTLGLQLTGKLITDVPQRIDTMVKVQ